VLSLFVAANFAVAVRADHEAPLAPLAEQLRAMATRLEKERDQAKAYLASNPNRPGKQKEVDDLTAELARIKRDPVGVLKGMAGTSPFGLKAGAPVYAVSEKAKVIDVGDDRTPLEVLSYNTGGGRQRYPSRFETKSAELGTLHHRSTVPVLDQFTVPSRLPGLKKGDTTKMANWYRIVDAGGTRDMLTATAVPFQFAEGDIATLKRLVTEPKEKPAERKWARDCITTLAPRLPRSRLMDVGPLLVAYAVTFGWAIVGSLSMAVGVFLALKIFTMATRGVDEWALIKAGTVPMAIILAALILSIGLVVASVTRTG
jgi:hypothetical protein